MKQNAKKDKSFKVYRKVKKRLYNQKTRYIILTRSLRRYIKNLKDQKKISYEEYKNIRKKIRNSQFRSKANLKEYIGGLNK